MNDGRGENDKSYRTVIFSVFTIIVRWYIPIVNGVEEEVKAFLARQKWEKKMIRSVRTGAGKSSTQKFIMNGAFRVRTYSRG